LTNKTKLKFWAVQGCVPQGQLLVLILSVPSKEEVGPEGEVAGRESMWVPQPVTQLRK